MEQEQAITMQTGDNERKEMRAAKWEGEAASPQLMTSPETSSQGLDSSDLGSEPHFFDNGSMHMRFGDDGVSSGHDGDSTGNADLSSQKGALIFQPRFWYGPSLPARISFCVPAQSRTSANLVAVDRSLAGLCCFHPQTRELLRQSGFYALATVQFCDRRLVAEPAQITCVP